MKQYCVISCPIDTYSGYGSRSRDLVKAIYELKGKEWHIEILSQRWGNTPWGYIKDHKETWGFIDPLINKTGQMQKQPDIWMQLTVPNEFQSVGKYNLGFTAGIETTICDPTWIEGVNRMNKTLVSSNHAKKVFEQSKFQQQDKSGKVIGTVTLQKPVEILFEGVDLNKYFEIKDKDLKNTDLVLELNKIKEEFCFLFLGHWLNGEIGHDRKNVGETIKTFLETFKDKKEKPALILKTSSAGSSIMDRDSILDRIDKIKNTVDSKDLPSIYLLHGEMDDYEINNLYNHPKVKAMVYLGHGEGYGRPLLEFSVVKKPIIASAWSGHMDFLFLEYTSMIGGELKNVHASALAKNMILADSQWFYPDLKQAEFCMKDLFTKYDKYLEKAKRQAYKSKTEFSLDRMRDALAPYLEEVPKVEALKLPQLKKIELPTLQPVK